MNYASSSLLRALYIAFAIGAVARAAPPNIVFILSDDAAWQAISAYNRDLPVKTPNLDRLAASGTRFDRCTVGNSICSPSRATLLTGTHSHVNGVINNYTRFDGRQLTYPKLLQAIGYQTALIGKWHLHTLPTGFDYFDMLDGQGNYFNAWFIRQRENGGAERYRESGHTDVVIGSKGVDWLRNRRDAERPFLLNLHFKVPHGPFMAPGDMLGAVGDVTFPETPTLFDDYEGRSRAIAAANMRLARNFGLRDMKVARIPEPTGADAEAWAAFHAQRRAEYERLPTEGPERLRWIYQTFWEDFMLCMLTLDREIGRVLDTLDELGLAENTIVMFAGDQGFFLGEHGFYDKRLMYEPAFRTPFLVRAPGVARPNSHHSALVQNIDWAPTILELAGLRVPTEMHGRSLVPLLRGETPSDWRKSVYYHYYEGPEADHRVGRHEGVATDRYKLIHFYEDNEWELYDLRDDPHEMKNRSGDPAMGSIEAELKAELGRLRDYFAVPPNETMPRTQRSMMRTSGVEYETAR